MNERINDDETKDRQARETNQPNKRTIHLFISIKQRHLSVSISILLLILYFFCFSTNCFRIQL